ncbi:hypothetical protein LF1_12650 [Rubripirellula obstinata]|uniref:HEAT repeat protein n=1 Tax=Rubripirellula obstinata TaxID=406547 RepID=A0A5B1CEV2_9BACT|nr:hypothetical protein [Rubripirellula obstinata]KAA1258742.1 hypothetical protein LF1_12650 [Rubripirellula obstinata]
MMFGLFQSRSPLATSQRVDLQWLMRRSRETFGDEAFHRNQVIRSVDEIQFDDSSVESKLQTIANSLSPRFDFGAGPLQWNVSNAEHFDEPVVYQSDENQAAIATVNAAAVKDDLQAIMTVANTLARHAWQHRRQRDLDVQPQTTSLLPIIVGLGVLASKASLLDKQWTTVGWSGWSLSRSGYYNTMEIGYAMALIDRIAKRVTNPNGKKPNWLRSLRLDSRSVYKQASRSFKKSDAAGEPLLFDADRIPSQKSNPQELAAWLAGQDPDFALAAAIVACNVACKLDNTSEIVIDAAMKATQRNDVELVAKAAEVLGHASPSNGSVKERLKDLARHRSPLVTLAAMKSAIQVGLPHSEFLSPAKRLLGAESFDLMPVLDWIQCGGRQCSELKPILLEHLEDAKRFNHATAMEALTHCIAQIESD